MSHNQSLVHYVLLGSKKPNGKSYTGNDWGWLEGPIDAARWLGYVEFDRIADERNMPPVIRPWEPPEPYAWVSSGELPVPEIEEEIHPAAQLVDMHGTQPYHLVLFGEKSSEADAGRHRRPVSADLYLPTGEISDDALANGQIDGNRSTSDDRLHGVCDPAGWQMPVSIAQKLPAFKVRNFHDMCFLCAVSRC